MFSCHTFCTNDRFDFFRRVAGIPLVDNIPERRKFVIVFATAVYAVAYRYKSDLRVREQNLRVISDHNVISTESRHIFYDHCSDLSVFYIGHHPFEVGAIEIRPRITVIDIIPAIRKTVCFRIISENFFLMHYTVAVTDLIVVAA